MTFNELVPAGDRCTCNDRSVVNIAMPHCSLAAAYELAPANKRMVMALLKLERWEGVCH